MTTSYGLSLVDPYCSLDRLRIYIWFFIANKTFSNKHRQAKSKAHIRSYISFPIFVEYEIQAYL